MNDNTCCFTGHRNLPPERITQIKERLEKTILHLISKGVRYFSAGGARGFDTLAAQAVLKLRSFYPHISLILVLPCPEQARRWSSQEQVVYEEIKMGADKIVYTSSHYYCGCMHRRNRYLVDISDCCVCYLTEKTGGTQYTVAYCRARGIPVINLADK